MKKMIAVVAMLLLGTTVLAGCNNNTANTEPDPELQALAQCLTDSGMKMYGTERCPHCQDQKEMFGPAFADVDYIDCDAEKNKCAVAGVTGYPTRVAGDGTQLVGTQELSSLAAAAGCEA